MHNVGLGGLGWVAETATFVFTGVMVVNIGVCYGHYKCYGHYILTNMIWI